MKIAIVRGDFLSGWEIPIFEPLATKHDVTIFLGKRPVYDVKIPNNIKVVKLYSPADLNFGTVSRFKMALLNRLFVDAHWLINLENHLRSFDVVYTAETLYAFSLQSVLAKEKGVVRSVVMHVGENIAFNNEGIWGKKWLKQKCLAGTDKFIAITDVAKKVLLEEGADKRKIVRINPGIDLKKFEKKQVTRFRTVQKNSNIKLLIVSRLIADKGLLEMIEIFISLSKKYNNIELVIVGTGPLAAKIDEKIKLKGLDNKVFRLEGVPYDDMSKVYNLCDIFIHYPRGSKTWLEQFGFVYVEAMACGLPIVTVDHGSAKEVVGNDGFVVTESKFSDTLSNLISNQNLRNKYSKISIATAKRKYDVQRYAKDLEKIFKQTLSS